MVIISWLWQPLGITSEPIFPFPPILKDSYPFADPRLSKSLISVTCNSVIQSPSTCHIPSKIMRGKTTKQESRTTANRVTVTWPLEIIEITDIIHLLIINIL